MDRIKIDQIIVVEGKYDKNTLGQIFDTIIIETGGFAIFNSKDKLNLIRSLAQKRQVLILTDSDSAGFLIRNYLKGVLPKDKVLHAYIPEICGKERRKAQASKEGLLGVEGIDRKTIADAVARAGARILDNHGREEAGLTAADLYDAGLLGGKDSKEKRAKLLRGMGLPGKLSSSAMLDVINAVCTRQEFFSAIEQYMDIRTKN